MALALALQQDAAGSFAGIDNGQNLIYVFFSVTPSGAYALGGDVLDFTKLLDSIKSGRPPLQVTIFSQKAGGGSGFVYGFAPGSTMANGKMQVFTGAAAQAALTELAAG